MMTSRDGSRPRYSQGHTQPQFETLFAGLKNNLPLKLCETVTLNVKC